MSLKMRHRTTRGARLMRVIETVSIRGDGTERDPIREVRQYWAADAETQLLAEHDPQNQRGRGCGCPALPGEPCPLNEIECSVRSQTIVTDYNHMGNGRA